MKANVIAVLINGDLNITVTDEDKADGFVLVVKPDGTSTFAPVSNGEAITTNQLFAQFKS